MAYNDQTAHPLHPPHEDRYDQQTKPTDEGKPETLKSSRSSLPWTTCKIPLHLDDPAHQAALRRHFGNNDTTIVLSEIPVRRIPSQQEGHRVPDLLIAFGVDRTLAIEQKGYSIRDQGKPPDFVLEIASESTGEEDYTGKRRDYAAFGIPEYWRFDSSGGQRHSSPLAGGRLVEQTYQPVDILVLNQYQSGMCISGRLTMTARTPRHLISPLGPNWVGTDSAV